MKNKKSPSYYLIGLILILCILIVYVGFFVKGIKPINNTNSSLNIVNSNVLSGDRVESHLKEDDTTKINDDMNNVKNTANNDVNKEFNEINEKNNNANAMNDNSNASNKIEEYTSGNNTSMDQPKDTISSVEALSDAINLENIDRLPAETILDMQLIGDIQVDNCFYYKDITEDIKLRINGKSYKEDCTVPYDELKYVRVLYYGFDDETHIGEIIVNTAIADDIVEIFKELYDAKYPMERVVLVDEYDADDNTSMAANNTSSFNYRTVPGATHLSKHALGLAIDVNPLYNPYIQYNEDETIILPIEGTPYADRNLDNPYYIRENDVCYNAFTKRGFTWGGFWESEPDYQHFQKVIN